MRTTLSLLLLSTALTALAMCSSPTSEPVTVWTSEPQVADYFEWYNANIEGAVVEVRPIEAGTGYHLLTSGDEAPDLIIDRNLLKGDAATRYAALNEIFEGRENEFYRPIIAAGRVDDTFHLAPLSFDVPAVMFADAWQPPQDERRSIDFNELREAAGAFNESDDERPVRMGYSPIWQPSFALAAVNAFGVRFRRGPEDMPLWSRDAVDEVLSFMRHWSTQTNPGAAAEQSFQDRYLVAPGNRTVQEGRAGFWYTTAAEFYAMPDREIANLDVRWLTRENTLDVGNHIRWAAIPAESDQPETARSLVRWLMNPQVQHQLIEDSYDDRQTSFGLAGGFSTIGYVNTRYLTETHPELTGRVPGESQLRRPVTEHVLWPRLGEQVVVPWLREAVRNEQDQPLAERVRSWLVQQEL